jgi:hypothetical protein
MINKILNSTCPFCNTQSHTDLESEDLYKYLVCKNCVNTNQNIRDVSFTYKNELLSVILIYLSNKDSELNYLHLIRLSFSEDNISLYFHKEGNIVFKQVVCDYIPEFSSIQELIQIVNTLMLFK